MVEVELLLLLLGFLLLLKRAICVICHDCGVLMVDDDGIDLFG